MTAHGTVNDTADLAGMNLDQALEAVGDPLAFLRAPKLWDRPGTPAQYTPPAVIPQVPSWFSSWEREQSSWRYGVSLMDQSHHMNGLYLSGRDTLDLLSGLACNKLYTSTPGRAHQIICCNDDGFMIGDAILFHLAEGEWFMCGAPFAVNWVRYQVEISGRDVQAEYEPRTPVYANGHPVTRRNCRFQIQGPRAWALIEKLNGGHLEDVAFFHLTELNIAGHRVDGLRHGMAGAAGLEIWAPWELRDELRQTILEAGREFDLMLVGSQAYLSSATESGWIPTSVQAIYTGDAMKAYREWLPVDELERHQRLGGSYLGERLEDYYVTPHDYGYGFMIDFEHEFIGRDALKAIDPASRRKKTSIAWNVDDTADLVREMLTPGGSRCKALHLPVLTMEACEAYYDALTVGDDVVGFGLYTAYTSNERAIISLGIVDQDIEIGTEIVMHWGEAGGGFGNARVEPDDIRPIRGIVSPTPYSAVTRAEYRA